jgi:tetratricopeptide (TPR) repeat protein/predicted Ser/Thr protein kinase
MNQEVERLFHAVADLSPDEREKEFARRGTAPELRGEVEALLRFDAVEDDSLTEWIVGAAQTTLDPTSVTAGERCGRYRLIRILGRGGMGSVYLAERDDGEVRHQVAIKLLSYGANDPAFRDRFLRERQILATLNHPGIARLLDAGHTEGGHPYLVMEHVDGTPIDDYAKALDRRARLRLFLQVCEAVSYLHRNLVVHRDLKPSNILVDRDGQPKLLDFGIAKIVDPSQAAAQEHTIAGFQPLTPQYASPEQVRGEAITTATDVYSLGVVLYQLLTDRYPYEFPSQTPTGIVQTICDVQPDPAGVSADLDNILSMALRKEPSRRYLSVQQFAEDVERALADRPVVARPDTVHYRAAKFVRRHRLALAAAIVIAAALLGEGGLALYQGRKAQQRFEQVRHLAHTFVFDLHDEVARLEGSTRAREMMVKTGLAYLDSLAANAGSDLELQREIAEAYVKIGDAEGYPTKPNLGRTEDAIASYRKAGDIYRQIAAQNKAYLPQLADYYLVFAFLLRFSDQNQARATVEKSLQTFDLVRAGGRFDEHLELRHAAAFCTLGDLDEDSGHFQAAWTEYSRCSSDIRSLLHRHRTREVVSGMANAQERVATCAQEMGLLKTARQALDEDESLLNELLTAEPHNPTFRRRKALLFQFRSRLYYDDRNPNFDDPVHALENARQYLAVAQEMVSSDPNNTAARFSRAVAGYRVSYSLQEFDPAEAAQVARDSVHDFDGLIAAGNGYRNTVFGRAEALQVLAAALLKGGKAREARPFADEAIAVNRSGLGTPDDLDRQAILSEALRVGARVNMSLRDFAAAERMVRESREFALLVAKSGSLPGAIGLANSEEALGNFYTRRGRVAEARESYGRLLDVWKRVSQSNEYVERRRAAAVRLLESVTPETPRG